MMPKWLDPKMKERCVRQMLERVSEYPSPTAAAEVVAKRNGVRTETVCRWYVQARVRRMEVANDILRRASSFFAAELDPRGR